jgi:hypothetical protein
MPGTDHPRLARRGAALVLLALLASPLAAEPTRIWLSSRIGVLHDENFFRSSTAVERKDLGSIGFTLDLFQQRPRTTYELQYVPSFEQEWQGSRYRADDQRLYLGVSHQLSPRSKLGLRERLLWSDIANSIQGDVEPIALVVAPRTRRFEHSLDVDLDHALSPHTGVVFGLEHQRYDYRTTRLFDTEAYGGSVGYAWHRERGSEMRAIARWLRHDPDLQAPTDITSVGVRYLEPVNRWQNLVLEAGGFSARGPITAGSDARSDRTGWYGDVIYGWSNGRFATSSVQLRRDVAPAPGVSVSTLADTAMLTTTISPLERLRLDFDAQGTRYSLLFGSRRVTDAFIGEVRARWLVRVDLALVAGWAHIYQQSNVPELDNLDYNRFYFGVSLPLYHRGPLQAPDGALPTPVVTN